MRKPTLKVLVQRLQGAVSVQPKIVRCCVHASTPSGAGSHIAR